MHNILASLKYLKNTWLKKKNPDECRMRRNHSVSPAKIYGAIFIILYSLMKIRLCGNLAMAACCITSILIVSQCWSSVGVKCTIFRAQHVVPYTHRLYSNAVWNEWLKIATMPLYRPVIFNILPPCHTCSSVRNLVPTRNEMPHAPLNSKSQVSSKLLLKCLRQFSNFASDET